VPLVFRWLKPLRYSRHWDDASQGYGPGRVYFGGSGGRGDSEYGGKG
jgi:hypothetical protein